MDGLEKAIQKAGGATALAKLIGAASSQVVTNWKCRGRVPAEMCGAIERATGIPRSELRPDVFETAA